MLQIERKLRYYDQQKQQMNMFKLEYLQLLEKLRVYQDTGNATEISKLQDRLSFIVEEGKRYSKNKEEQMKEIKDLQSRIEELKRANQ